MSAPNPSQNATKRITCAQCGANNYVGGTHCWQCGKSLDQSGKSDRPASILPDPPLVSAGVSYTEPPIISAAMARPMQPIVLPTERVDPDLAPKAAAALGLIFPIVAIPAGIIFLMLDDARKVRLGWITIWWSVGGSVIGFILSLLSLAPLMGLLHGFAPHGGGNPLQSLAPPDVSGDQ